MLLQKVSFSMINNLSAPSSELQINFDVPQTDTENHATGKGTNKKKYLERTTGKFSQRRLCKEFSRSGLLGTFY